jgi:hypothetical protein
MQQAQAAERMANAQLKQAQTAKTQAEAQAVLPKAHAEIEKDLAQAGHAHTHDAMDMANFFNPPPPETPSHESQF